MFLDRKFFSNVSKLAGATIIAEAIGIITVPIYTRLFSPDVVGQFALLTSAIGLCGVFSTGRYELAVVLPKQDSEARSIIRGTILWSVIWSLLLTLLIYVFKGNIVEIGEYYKIVDYLYFIPLFVFLEACIKLFRYWCNRKQQFGLNAGLVITNSVVWKGGNILLGFWGFVDAITLIMVRLASQVVEIIARFINYFKLVAREKIRTNKAEVKIQLRNYKRFPLIDVWNGLLDQGSILIVPILLSVFFSTTEVGLYSQSMQIVQLPLAFVSGAFGQVFFQKFAQEENSKAAQMISESFVLLLSISVPIFTVLGLFGKSLFSFVLGSRWAMSGLYAQVLAPWCCLRLVWSPLSVYFEASQRQHIFLIITALTIVTRVISIVLGGLLENCFLAIVFFGISGVVVNLIGLLLLFKHSGTRMSDIKIAFFELWSRLKSRIHFGSSKQ